MKIDGTSFWNRLDFLLKQSGLDLTGFCKKTNLSYHTVISQRARNTIPKVEQLLLMAQVLNVSLDYLISGKEPTDPLMKKLKENLNLGKLVNRISLCNKEQLQTLNILLDSWGIDKAVGESIEQGENLA